VEPQWNPSVEEQAIARAVRMGQTRKVTIIRYIVQRSVEQVRYQPARLKVLQFLIAFMLGRTLSTCKRRSNILQNLPLINLMKERLGNLM
jgi:hypothetical protein